MFLTGDQELVEIQQSKWKKWYNELDIRLQEASKLGNDGGDAFDRQRVLQALWHFSEQPADQSDMPAFAGVWNPFAGEGEEKQKLLVATPVYVALILKEYDLAYRLLQQGYGLSFDEWAYIDDYNAEQKMWECQVRRPELYPDRPVNCKWYDRPEVYLKAFLMDACTIPDELLKKIWEAMEAQLKRENSLTEQDSGRSWMDFSKNQVTVPTLFAKMSNAAYDFGYWTVYIRKLYTCSRMVFDLYLGHWWSMEDNTIPAEELWVKAWAPVQEAVVECCKDDPWYLKRMFMSFLRFPVFQRYHENLSGALKMENMNSLARCGALFSQSEEGRQRFLEYVLRQCPHDPDIRPAYRSMMEDLKWDLYEILVSSRSACWGQGVWTYIKNAAWLWGDNVTLRFTVDANKMWQFKEIIQELFLYHENEGSLEYIKSVTYTVCDDDPARNALENVCREEMRQYVLDELCRKNRKEMIVTAYQKGFFGKEQLEKWFINKRRRKCIKDVLPELKALLKDENTPYCEGAGE